MPRDHSGKIPVASRSGAGKLSPRRLATAKKRAAATKLRAAGRTFKQIAVELGVTTGRAYQLVDEALYATIAAPAERLRQIELARLDQLLRGVYGKAIRGDHSAIGSVLKIIARIERLTGLDAPQPAPPDGSPREGAFGDSLTLRFIDAATGKAIEGFGQIPSGIRRCPKGPFKLRHSRLLFGDRTDRPTFPTTVSAHYRTAQSHRETNSQQSFALHPLVGGRRAAGRERKSRNHPLHYLARPKSGVVSFHAGLARRVPTRRRAEENSPQGDRERSLAPIGT
jgi:hypothetical protein